MAFGGRRSDFQLEVLEPRILLSADGAAVAPGSADDDPGAVEEVVFFETPHAAEQAAGTERAADAEVPDDGAIEVVVVDGGGDEGVATAPGGDPGQRDADPDAADEAPVLVPVDPPSDAVDDAISPAGASGEPDPTPGILVETLHAAHGPPAAAVTAEEVVDAVISPEAGTALVDGFSDFATWLDGLGGHGAFGVELPVIGVRPGELFDPGAFARERLAVLVSEYLAADATPTTAELAVAFGDLAGVFGDTVVTLDGGGVVGGLADGPFGDELVFGLDLSAVRSLALDLDFGGSAGVLDLEAAAGATLDVAAEFRLAAEVGVLLEGGLGPSEAFFLRFEALELTLSALSENADVAFDLGFLGVNSTGARLEFRAMIDVAVADPEPDAEGTISVADLLGSDLASLVTIDTSGSTVDIDLPVRVSGVSGLFVNGNPTVTIDGDPFSPDGLAYDLEGSATRIEQVRAFLHADEEGLVDTLTLFAGWLGQVSRTDPFVVDLPGLDGVRLDEVFDLGEGFQTGVVDALSQEIDDAVEYAFSNAQEFAAELAGLLGLPVTPTFNGSTRELRFTIADEIDLVDETASVDLGRDFGVLGGIEASGEATAAVGGSFSATLILGLGIFEARVAAAASLPADHSLSAPALFEIQVGSEAVPVPVAVPAGTRADRETLVADIQAAVDAAGLAGVVMVGADEATGALTLTTTSLTGAYLAVTAEADDPAVTELGLEPFAVDSDALTSRLKVDDFEALAHAAVTGSGISAEADFGLVGIQATGGTLEASIQVAVDVDDPDAPGAPVPLERLFEATGDIADFVAVDVDGSLAFTLPNIMVTSALPIVTGGEASISVTVPDVTNPATFTVTHEGLDELVRFEKLDFDSVLDGLREVRDFLELLGNHPALRELVPGLSDTLAETLALADPFLEALEVLEDPSAAEPVLDDLAARLEAAFGLNPGDVMLGWTGTDLTLDLAVSRAWSADERFALDLDDLGISSLGTLLEVGASGSVAVDVEVDFALGLGFDLADPATPRFFVADDSAVTVGLGLEAAGLGFTTTLGPLELGVAGGSAVVERSGGGPAALTLALDPGTDGRHYANQLGLGILDLSGDAEAHVDLPIESNGSPVGAIVVDIADLTDPAGTLDTSGTTVDLDALVASLDLFADPAALENGIEFLLEQLDALLGTRLGEVELPFVGASLAEALAFVGVIGSEIGAGFSGAASAAAARSALAAAFGSGGLGWLVDRDGDGAMDADDIRFLDPGTRAEVADPSTLTDGFLLDFVLEELAYATSAAIDFSVGLPGLALSVEEGSTVTLDIGFRLHLQIGVTKTQGVFLGTDVRDDADQPEPELTLFVEASIPGFAATGQLAFLELEAWDWATAPADVRGASGPYDPSALSLEITVDIDDPVGGGDRLTYAEVSGGGVTLGDVFDFELVGQADINLALRASLAGGLVDLPSLLATLDVTWTFSSGAGLSGDVPAVAFRDVRVDVGEFLNNLLGPILGPINDVIAPLQPVLDFLQTELPLGGSTVLEVIGKLGGGDYESVVRFIDAVITVANFADRFASVSSGTYFELGEFEITGSDLRSGSAADIDLGGAGVLVNAVSESALASQFEGLGGEISSDRDKSGTFRLPLVENPLAAFGLLLGQDVVLVEYELPRLTFSTDDIDFLLAVIPVFGVPVSLKLFGGLGLTVDLAFGYDTFGARKFAEGGFADPTALLDGLYIADWRNGVDVPEVTLFAELGVSASVDAAVAEIGVKGGLRGEIGLNLNEDARPEEGGVEDGRIRWFELNPFCLFDVSGAVSFFVKAFAKVGICPFCVKGSVKLVDITLISFDYEADCDPVPPVLADYDAGDGTVTLNMGPRAAERLRHNTTDGDEEFTVTRGDRPGTIFVSAFGFRQLYGPAEGSGEPAVSRIVGDAGQGDDVVNISRRLEVPAELDGGSGNDQLVGSGVADILRGGPGEDRLTGNEGNDLLYGDGDADILRGGDGADQLFGGAGIDNLFGEDGDDELAGGSGDDILDGGDGGDTLLGDSGNDTLLGGPGGDTLRGGDGDDQADGGLGDDQLWGDAGNDGLRGGFGSDRIRGGPGFDILVGGGGSDFLYGADGTGAGEDPVVPAPGSGFAFNDRLYGDYAAGTPFEDGSLDAAGGDPEPEGDDELHGNGGPDFLSGEGGNDTLFGGDGDDVIEGSGGSDVVFGGAGADEVSGGAGADIIQGDAGDDILRGDGGADTIRGGLGADVIRGGGGPDDIDGQAGDDRIYGDAGNDVIRGGSGADVIYGVSGTDTVEGQGDADTIFGGTGDDELFGDEGDDFVFGNPGDDRIRGGLGADFLFGNTGRDEVHGDAGDDRIFGGPDEDRLFGEGDDDHIEGGDAPDFILGGDGADTILGGEGNDVAHGGDGDDTIEGEGGDDLLFGERGRDEVHGDSSSDPAVSGHDSIELGDGDDTGFGGPGEDVIDGGDGDDEIDGGSGNDVVDGGRGGDTLRGGEGDDRLRAGEGVAGTETLFGDAGDDEIIGSDAGGDDAGVAAPGYDGASGDRLFGGEGDDRIFGLGGADLIDGGPGADWIDGGAHGDRILGGDGDDVLHGSFGDDVLLGGAGRDRAFGELGDDVLDGGDGPDVLDGGFGADRLLGGPGDDELRAGFGDGDELFGEEGDDVLIGSPDGGDHLDGGPGRDRLIGDAGNDTLLGGPGDDLLDGGAGSDLLEGGAGADLAEGGADDDVLHGHTADGAGDDGAVDTLYGDFGTGGSEPGSGNDELHGGAGNDLLYGEGGDDLLDGGSGASDLIEFGSGEGADPADFPGISVAPAPAAVPVAESGRGEASLPSGLEAAGIWSGLSGSGPESGGGFAAPDASALTEDPALAVSMVTPGLFGVAWADARRGNFEIYVAWFTGGAWTTGGGGAGFGGVSQSQTSSRRPSLAFDAADSPLVAWAEHDAAGGSEIRVARWDAAGGIWAPLGGPLGSGIADAPELVLVAGDPVVFWRDDGTGAARVHAARWDGGAWVDFGAGSMTGGITANGTDVGAFDAAGSGTSVAVAWEQPGGSSIDVHARIWNGSSWVGVAGSDAPGGVSAAAMDSRAPSAEWHDDDLFVAWEQQTESGTRIFGEVLDGAAWSAPGGSPGLTPPPDPLGWKLERAPDLAAGGGALALGFSDAALEDRGSQRDRLFVREWEGGAFAERLPDDASGFGVADTDSVRAFDLAVGTDGLPAVVWAEGSIDRPVLTLVARSLDLSGAVLAAGGGDPSVQALLDANALGTGDVIVLAPGAHPGFTVGADDAGVAIVGAAAFGTSLTGPVTIVGGHGVVLEGLVFTDGLVIDGADGVVVRDSRFHGGGIELRDSAGARLIGNELAGGAGDTGVAVQDGVTDAAIVGNRFSFAGGTGLRIAAPAEGTVTANRFEGTGTGTGIEIAAAFSGGITDNTIGGFGTGVAYDAPASLAGNVLAGNATGIRTTVAGPGFLGSLDSGAPNVITGSQTGVLLVDGAVAAGQIVRGNVTGIAGSGIAGGENRAGGNRVEGNGTGIDVRGEVRFNHLHGNGVGIVVSGAFDLVHHNVVSESTSAGIRVAGTAERARVFLNTVWSTTGRGVEVIAGAAESEILGNILWAEGAGATALWIDTLAHVGTHSDFNTLHASDGGLMAHFILDFDDILDWQRDLERFDLHSTGTTVVDPDGATPAFANRWHGDFAVLERLGGRRASSPTLDGGTPLLDGGVLPGQGPNLLANGGFENGLAGWNASPGSSAGEPGAPAYEGGAYFSAGASDASFVEQVVDLAAAGWSSAEIDALDVYAIFGGRFRTAAVALPSLADVGVLEVTFLAAGGGELETVVVEALETSTDRWELFGGRHLVPEGTRAILFRFEGDRRSGSLNDAVLDGAFLRLVPEAAGIDQGAFGGVGGDVDEASPRLLLRTPDLYVDWERGLPHTIRWDSFGNVDELPVAVSLYRDTPEGPAFHAVVAIATADSGRFTWIPENTAGVDFGSDGWRIAISLVGRPEVADRSAEGFAVPEDSRDYFVNDGSLAGDQFTTRTGDNRLTGRTPDKPKPYPNNILGLYALGATETLHVDAGDYVNFRPIVLSGTIAVADDEGFVFTGPDTGGAVVLRHAHPATEAPVIALSDADFVTLANLELRDGLRGVHLFDNSTDFTARGLVLAGHAEEGFLAEGTSTVLSLRDLRVEDNGGRGIDSRVSIGELSGSILIANGEEGAYLVSQPGVRIEGNEVRNNGAEGLFVTGSGLVISGNIVSGNSDDGIYAGGTGSRIEGNTVSGHSVANTAGIRQGGGVLATGNVVHGNWRGIEAQGGQVEYNRVYDNATQGILVTGDGTSARGNVAYSNGIGIQVGGFRGGDTVANNVVYANEIAGLRFTRVGSDAANDLVVENNTVYEPVADGIRIEPSAGQFVLRNNVVVVGEGTGLHVASNAQVGFESDFNLVQVTGPGAVGNWQGAARITLADWRSASFGDFNSLSGDPRFVDPDGADGILGFGGAGAADGRDDDFHLMSAHGSFHGGALAPAIDAATGLPTPLPPALATDGVTSPGIDRGDDASAFGNEPAPNGGFVNLGAYGNTEQASLSPATYVTVLRPDGGEVVPALQALAVRWRSHDTGSTVTIDLLDPAGSLVAVLGAGEANDGAFDWPVPDDGSIPLDAEYRIRVTRADSGLSDTSGATFTLSSPISVYYVNDAVVEPGSRSTAPGSDANDGLSPATPKASVRAILAEYDLGPGDTVFVDAGTYLLTTTITIGAGDAGVRIEGFHDPAFPELFALLDRGDPGTGEPVILLEDADGITLDSLRITGGERGIHAPSGSDSDGVTLSNNVIAGNEREGILLDSSNDDAVIVGNRLQRVEAGMASSDQDTGVRTDGARATITGNTVVHHSSRGIDVNGADSIISDNIVSQNGAAGIDVSGGGGRIVGNRVFDNTDSGIQISGGVVAEGNVVSGHVASGGEGIRMSGGTSRGNTVHGNRVGIAGYGVIENNRVFGNVAYGIAVSSSATVAENVVYSNGIGVRLAGYFADILFRNNVVYDSATYGVQVARSGPAGVPVLYVENNTIHEPSADAVRVEGGAANIALRNNILSVLGDGAAAISVEPGSEDGFASDYNFVELGEGAVFGDWRDVDLPTRADWFFELGFDGQSSTGDPGFLDPDGPDDRLGNDPSAAGEPLVVDDGDPGFSVEGPWSVVPGAGRGDQHHRLEAGVVTLAESATWSFAGLEAGRTYEVYATWSSSFSSTSTALYEVREEGVLVGARTLSQRGAPSGLEAEGSTWSRIGVVTVEGDSLEVTLSTIRAGGHFSADAVLLLPRVGDGGGDDLFDVAVDSPTIDGGDPHSWFLAEPAPNGGRANQGATGNTPSARLSPEEVVQILSPNGNEKFESGGPLPVVFRAFGFAEELPVARVNFGGPTIGHWLAERYRVSGGSASSTSNAIDLSAAVLPAPEDVYRQSIYSDGILRWEFPVPDGAYTLRLHAAEPNSVNNRFDVRVGGVTVADEVGPGALAGGRFVAHVFEFDVAASSGSGLVLEVEAVAGRAYVAGLEILRTNPGAAPATTVALEFSADEGSTWEAVPGAGSLAVDRYGDGRLDWVAPAPTDGNTALVRASAGSSVDASDAPFLIAPDGVDYYVNDTLDELDEFATVAGDNAASGKSPDAPMASLAALIRAYDLDPGDVVHVDHGFYSPIQNIVVDAGDAGVLVRGPSGGGEAVLDRGSIESGAVIFDLVDADGFAIERLTLQGAEIAVHAGNGADSDGVRIIDSVLANNDRYGLYFWNSNDAVEIRGSRFFGSPSGGGGNNQDYGVRIDGDRYVVEANSFFDLTSIGIDVSGDGGTVSDNRIHGVSTGIDVTGSGTLVTGNDIFDTRDGIRAAGSIAVVGNRVHDNRDPGATAITISGGEARENLVYGNRAGIQASGSRVVDNTVYGQIGWGIILTGSSTATGNWIYGNDRGLVVTGYAAAHRIEGNLIYDNAAVGIDVARSAPANSSSVLVHNNTVRQIDGVAIRVGGSSRGIDLRNNLLEVAGADAAAVSVGFDEQHEFTSDFNGFHLVDGAAIGTWEDARFTSLREWAWEFGLDVHSRTGNPAFVDPDGADGVPGFDGAPSGAPVVVDDADPSFSATDGWVLSGDGGFHRLADGGPDEVATWTVSGLTAGALYRVGVWWPGQFEHSTYVRYEVVEGDPDRPVVLATQDFGRNPSEDFEAAGRSWGLLGWVQPTGDEIRVVLRSVDGGPVLYADQVVVERLGGDFGGDDDFRVAPGSYSIDAGDPASPSQAEPWPNGGRVNLGHTGNTPTAAGSPSRVVQITGPVDGARLEENAVEPVSFRLSGFLDVEPALLLNVNGDSTGLWSADRYGTERGGASTSTREIRLGAIDDPAPAEVYSSYSYPDRSVGARLAWSIPLTEGSYAVRLHVMSGSGSAGFAAFDLRAGGAVILEGFDVGAAAGGTAWTPVAASAGFEHEGGALELVLETTVARDFTYVAALELLRLDPDGIPAAEADVRLEFSPNGGADWEGVPGAAGLPADRHARGTFDWGVAGPLDDFTGKFRAIAGGVTRAMPGTFRIVDDGNLYFVNDGDTTGDEFTRAAGDPAASGKSPDEPMASLGALIRAYDLDPSDIVFVDDGDYRVLADIVIGAEDAGVTVRGPTAGGEALLDRKNASGGRHVIELVDADGALLDRLSVTGGESGVVVRGSADFVLTSSRVFGNELFGLFLDANSHDAVVTDSEFFGIPGGTSVDNQNEGIRAEGDRLLVEDSRFFDHQQEGIEIATSASDAVARRIEVFSNGGSGVIAVGPNGIVEDSEIHDNGTSGVRAAGGTIVRDNIVYGHAGQGDEGIYLSSGVAENNRVFGGATGIVMPGGIARANFVFDNVVGIATTGGIVEGNHVYGNRTGISAGGYATNIRLWSNLVYQNTDTGILVNGRSGPSSGTPPAQITNNTVYQEVGTAVGAGASRDVVLRNNIVWVEVGFGIDVAANAQTGFIAERNVLFTSSDPAAFIGRWGGAGAAELSDWQALSGADGDSLQAMPVFVDRDGPDGVFGFTQADGDGGADDNFYLRRGSPGLDFGESLWAPATDAIGAIHRDDPGTPNQGTPTYSIQLPGDSAYAETGEPRNWRGGNSRWELAFPDGFAFPYFGVEYDAVFVSSNGLLQLGADNAANDPGNSTAALDDWIRIAPLWDDLRTTGSGDDIFVDESVAGQVTIRWDATHASSGSDVRFSATLFDDGRIRFDYAASGEGTNDGLTPTIGISAGEGLWTLRSFFDGQPSVGSGASVLYTPGPGVVDAGAYSFGGSSLDLTGPQGIASDPAVVANQGVASSAIFRLAVEFDKAVNPIDATSLGNFDLRAAGGNGIFGDADDRVFELRVGYEIDARLLEPGQPEYGFVALEEGSMITFPDVCKIAEGCGTTFQPGIPLFGENVRQTGQPVYGSVSVIEILDGPLPAGEYRLTLSGTTSIHDLSGNRIDGDGDGAPGGDFVRFFSVEAELEPPTVEQVLVSGSGWSDAFLEAVDPGRGLGVPVSVGAAQLEALPFAGIDEVHMIFSEFMALEFDRLGVGSATGQNYFVTNFSFDPATNTASWRLSQPIAGDRVQLVLDDAATDWWGNALDGEWTDGASTRSGDGAAGGDLVMQINALAGDVNADGVTNDRDLYAVWAETRKAPESRDLARFDLDGDGRVTDGDVDVVVRNYRSGLPAPPADGAFFFASFAPTPPPDFVVTVDGPADHGTGAVSLFPRILKEGTDAAQGRPARLEARRVPLPSEAGEDAEPALPERHAGGTTSETWRDRVAAMDDDREPPPWGGGAHGSWRWAPVPPERPLWIDWLDPADGNGDDDDDNVFEAPMEESEGDR